MLRRKLRALRQAVNRLDFGSERRVVERDAALKGGWAGVVHVVTLDALVHDAEPPRTMVLPSPQVIWQTDARSEIEPGILHQTFGIPFWPEMPIPFK